MNLQPFRGYDPNIPVILTATIAGQLPIIRSILDLDLYKLTVQQIAYNRFANIVTRYEFKCRNKDLLDIRKYVPLEELNYEVYKNLPKVQLTQEEYNELKSKGYFQENYLTYLQMFRFMPEKHIVIVPEKDGYKIIAEGPWPAVILYETIILCIITEIYLRNYLKANGIELGRAKAEGLKRFFAKAELLKEYNKECIAAGFNEPQFIEFGTRRRFSREWQTEILENLIAELPDNLAGTSNVYLAMRYGLREVGTFGHEFPMTMQGIFPIQKSQVMAARIWLEEYKGLWGTFLGDTLGDDKFFKDFTFDLAKGYDGVRHDSGDPFAYGERIIAMYEGYNINPKTKKIVFSDGLDIPTMIALHRQFRGRIQVLFGIGTNLTNDLGTPVLQNVMKVTMSNGQDVCKLSANIAKASCNNQLYLDYVRMAIQNY